MGEEVPSRTQVGIVGAGPAGLVLGHLLHREGIEAVVLESRSREYVEARVRAGVLEQGTVDLLIETGVGDRLQDQGIVHHGIELRFGGRGHRIPFDELADGRGITIYGQQEVVKDLIAARLDTGAPLVFEAEAIGVEGIEGDSPTIRFRHRDAEHELRCDAVAGCDGYHGVCREAAPTGALTQFARDYPFAWLGILAEVAPSTDELIYAYHERGFSLHSLRSPSLSRLYVQCDAGDTLDEWPDERIWQELHTRLARDDGWTLDEGPIVERTIAPMRSVVTEPMQHGRLYLAGDAVHIVPATGAKGLNLAVADVRILAEALAEWFRSGSERLLELYSETCLRRVWQTQSFSAWMTSMLHRFPDADDYAVRLQHAQLDHVCRSRAAAASLAEQYVGLELAQTKSSI
jgi:p-hydroxybenzoate 3-monooxygenase